MSAAGAECGLHLVGFRWIISLSGVPSDWSEGSIDLELGILMESLYFSFFRID